MANSRLAVRPAVFASVLVAFASAALLLLAAASAGDDGVRRPAVSRLGEELTALRTRTAKTFASPDGRGYVSRLFPAPVHYRDAAGEWQEIDDELVRDTDGSGFTNRSNRHEVEMPGRLAARPVRVADGGRWLSFELEDAGAAPAGIAANRARYDGVFPGVDVELEAQADAVKETLTLASADTRSSFDYRLDASTGLRPRETRDGGVELVDRDGETHFALPAPFVYE